MIVEIRTYRLKPGTSTEFVRAMRDEVGPLLADAGIDLVATGASLIPEDGHEEAYLIRAFASTEQRDAQEEAFYGGEPWRTGPREKIMSRIECYHTIVVDLPAVAVDALRG